MVNDTIHIATGFKQTKIGIIPENWEVKKFAQIADIDKESLNGNTLNKYEFNYISLSDVDSENSQIVTTRQIFKTAPSRARRVVRQGDILMSTVRPNLQGFAIIKDKVENLIASTGFAVIRTKHCSNEYLFHYLFSQFISKQFYQLLVGSNYPAINSSDVKHLQIPLPPFPEQRAIAACLSTWDKAIDKTQQLIAQLKQRNKGLMQQLLTGKIRLKNENGEKFCGEWKEYSYNQLLKVIQRPVKWDDNELYQLISVRRRSGGIFNRDSLFGHQIKVKNLRATEEGDFLFSKMQIVHGASALVTQEYSGAKISGSYIATIAKDPNKLNMRFFNWYSKLPYFYYQTYISSYGVHIEKMTFNFRSFLKLKMNVPSIEEQTAIASVLDKATQEVQLQEDKLAAMKAQKKGLMQVLLTGKVRLRSAREKRLNRGLDGLKDDTDEL